MKEIIYAECDRDFTKNGCIHIWSADYPDIKRDIHIFGDINDLNNKIFIVGIAGEIEGRVRKRNGQLPFKVHIIKDVSENPLEKIDRESLEKAKKLIEEIDFLVKGWLEGKGYMTFREKVIPENPYLPKDYKKIMELRCLLQQMNKDYRDFIEKHLLADLPINPLDLSELYQAELERIMNIKI